MRIRCRKAKHIHETHSIGEVKRHCRECNLAFPVTVDHMYGDSGVESAVRGILSKAASMSMFCPRWDTGIEIEEVK